MGVRFDQLSHGASIALTYMRAGYELAALDNKAWLVTAAESIGWNLLGNCIPFEAVEELLGHGLIVQLDHTYETLGSPTLYGAAMREES